MGTVFRRLDADDFDFAINLSEKEKWYLTAYDLGLYVIDGQGAGTVAVDSGTPVGMATAAIYGGSAWIGNVVIEPASRNRGLGRKLVEAHMRALNASGVDSFFLYAYDRSRPLYERMGFTFDAMLWEIALTGARGKDSGEVSHGYDSALEKADLRYFPCSRKHVLVRSAARKDAEVIIHRDPNGDVDGYLFTSFVDSKYGSEVAPFVCRIEDAGTLIAASAAASAGGSIHMYVPENNIGTLERQGFALRRLRRIHRGYAGSSACLPVLGPEVMSAGFLETG